jgi:hypothetical protein
MDQFAVAGILPLFTDPIAIGLLTFNICRLFLAGNTRFPIFAPEIVVRRERGRSLLLL